MTDGDDIGILGVGWQLPETVRGNDDPIFDWLRQNQPPGKDCFQGYKFRRVLKDDETVLDILAPAAIKALDDAGIEAGAIDHLIGSVSPSTYAVPTDLFALAARLGLRETALTIPIANDFSNFNVALVLADSLVRAGRARNVLVAIGGGWTRAVSYHTPQAASVGDGAAAVVVGRGASPRWRLIDSEVITREGNFGEMALVGDYRQVAPPDDPPEQEWTGPYFHINDEGLENFSTFGGQIAVQAAIRLRNRQRVDPNDLTIIGHQVSEVLFNMWRETFAPSPVFETLSEYGNMTVASIPVNLCLIDKAPPTRHLIALSLAPDMHAHAILLRRN